jgi:ABC-type transport system involved in multi-copper enzyme maturation permease subunit
MTAALAAPGVTQSRVIVSEWIKLRSLRSTWFSLAAAVIVSIGLGTLFSYLRGRDFAQHAGPMDTLDATQVSLRGVYLAQLAVGVLGVLLITGEYATGMIRASLSAVPQRRPLLLGKIVVFGAFTFVLTTLMCLVAFLAGQAALSHYELGVSLTTSGAVRAVLGGGFFLTVIGLIGLGFGFALRSTGGAIASLFGLVLVAPLLAQALPNSWQDHVDKYLPLNCLDAVIATTHVDSRTLSPGSGFAVLAAYAVVVLTAGYLVLRRRDA